MNEVVEALSSIEGSVANINEMNQKIANAAKRNNH
jgi:methyl-accepting chemotaxis protein